MAMKKYNLYWTSCEAHYIDLMFEDIGKIATVLELITNARKSSTSSTIMVACLGKWERSMVEILCVRGQQDL